MARLDYYATSQLVLVDAATGRKQDLGQPAVFSAIDPAPGSEFFLVTTTRKPFSRLLGAWGFPSEIVVGDRRGKFVHTMATLPSHEGVPMEGVLTAPRINLSNGLADSIGLSACGPHGWVNQAVRWNQHEISQ